MSERVRHILENTIIGGLFETRNPRERREREERFRLAQKLWGEGAVMHEVEEKLGIKHPKTISFRGLRTSQYDP